MFYAGSWGDPYEHIVGLLAGYLGERPDADVRALYDEKPRLGKHDLRYIVNAMIVEELDRRFDFETIVDVLHSGKEGEAYFAKIEAHLGIDGAKLDGWVRTRLQERG